MKRTRRGGEEVSLKKDDLCIRQQFAGAASHPRHSAQPVSTRADRQGQRRIIAGVMRDGQRWSNEVYMSTFELTGEFTRKAAEL